MRLFTEKHLKPALHIIFTHCKKQNKNIKMFLEVQNALKVTKIKKCAPKKFLSDLVIQQNLAILPKFYD